MPSPATGDRTAAPAGGTIYSARRTVLAALVLALCGAAFGLVAGDVSGAETWLITACAVFCAILLFVLVRRPFDEIPWITPAACGFFYLYLVAGSLLAMRDASMVGSFVVYLVWFFPLLAFNRLVNTYPHARTLSILIFSSAVALALTRAFGFSEDAAEVPVLVVYALACAAFLAILGLFAEYREAFIREQARSAHRDALHRALRRRDEEMRNVFANAASGIGWMSAAGDCEHVNSTFGRLVGREASALRAVPFADLVLAEDRPRWAEILASLQAGGRRELTADLRLVRSNAEILWTRVSLARMQEAEGGAEGFAFVCLDATESREMEARLQQSQRLEAIGRLTGGVAHDFNNLLTVIVGGLETLEHGLPGHSELGATARMARLAADRGAALTNQLLAFSRRQPLEPKPTDVRRLLDGIRALLQRSLGERVVLEIAGGEAAHPALVDRIQLESAVLNLCINARDAMPEGGRVRIDVADVRDSSGPDGSDHAPPRDYVRVSVSDDGVGIAPDVLPRVFEPFFTTKEVGRGSGLGLSMVYGFVKQSNGFVRIDTAPGRGTTLELFLPRAPSDASGGASPPASRPEAAPRAATILVVEDDELVRENAVQQLGRLGYRVVAVGSGSDALDVLAQRTDIDLLFTDTIMPGDLDGVELAAEALRLRPNLPIVLTTGYADTLTGPRGALPERVLLLGKPYRQRELAEKIARALDRG